MTNRRDELLKSVFGFSSFRPLQEEAVEAIVQGRDLLMILPTGGGKSLCYQLPALLKEGLTVVVSPLLALMHDQVSALQGLGIKAEMLSSMQQPHEIEAIRARLFAGDIKLLYVAPERLSAPGFVQMLKQLRVDLFVIDEAHCVSEWGHEFRADYRRLGLLKTHFPAASIAAFTATATQKVQDDIVAQLHLDAPKTIRGTIFRENLEVRVRHRIKDGRNQLLDFLALHEGESGIVYTFTRKAAENTAHFLQQKGISAKAYHAGLDAAERNATYHAFVHDEIDVVVATVAFGMGIDKSNIRFVVHMSLPKTIENYYQEIGRAGRDGLDSEVLLLYSAADIVQRKGLIDQLEDSPYKQLAYDKLQSLVRFANAEQCRHRLLAAYFDDAIEACGSKCDNCIEPEREKEEITVEAQKFLSALYRTGQRFGMHYIADVLRGSTERRILENGHEQLSVYGIGKERGKGQWLSIGDRLLELGAVAMGEYKTVQITPEGFALLKQKEPVFIAKERLETKAGSKEKRVSETVDYDASLFERLRELRKTLAQEGEVAPYMVFSDKTLKEMASIAPQNRQQMLDVSGVGEVKFERYGEQFLDVLKTAEKEDV
jgi:ATP-dependent DNA helicase RecQ